MSYANRKQMSSNRTAAIVVVALIHILLGYALVSGLAYSVVKQAAEDLKTFDDEEEPPPPEEVQAAVLEWRKQLNEGLEYISNVLGAGMASVWKNPLVSGLDPDQKANLGKQRVAMSGKIEATEWKLQKHFDTGGTASGKKWKGLVWDLAHFKDELKRIQDQMSSDVGWAGVKNKARNLFKDFGKPFEGPMIRFMATLQGMFAKIAPSIKQMGVLIAPIIDKLGPGLVGMFTKMMPGMLDGVKASVPFLEKLADGLPRLGEGIGNFFKAMARGAPDALEWFKGFGRWLVSTIENIGGFVADLSNIFEAAWPPVKKFFKAIGEVFLGETFRKLKKDGAEAFGSLSDAIRDNREELKIAAGVFGMFAKVFSRHVFGSIVELFVSLVGIVEL